MSAAPVAVRLVLSCSARLLFCEAAPSGLSIGFFFHPFFFFLSPSCSLRIHRRSTCTLHTVFGKGNPIILVQANKRVPCAGHGNDAVWTLALLVSFWLSRNGCLFFFSAGRSGGLASNLSLPLPDDGVVFFFFFLPRGWDPILLPSASYDGRPRHAASGWPSRTAARRRVTQNEANQTKAAFHSRKENEKKRGPRESAGPVVPGPAVPIPLSGGMRGP